MAPPGQAASSIWRRAGLWLAGLALALPLALALALAWLAGSEPGLRALTGLAGRASGGALAIDGASGRLLGPLRLEAVRVTAPGLRAGVREVELDWDAAALWDGRLRILRLHAASVDVATAASDDAARLPARIGLPLPVELEGLAVGRLRVGRLDGAGAVTPLVELGAIEAQAASDGLRHRLARLRFTGPAVEAEVEARLEGMRPFPLSASARLAGRHDDQAFRVDAQAEGNLEALAVRAQVSGLEAEGRLEVDLTPYAAVPFTRLSAQASGLDPALFFAGAPSAKLGVSVEFAPEAAPGDTPLPPEQWVLAGPLELRNAAPGPADRQAIPVQRAAAQARWAHGRLALSELVVELPRKGRARGDAAWQDGRFEAQLRLAEVDLAALAAALKPTRLAGEIRASGDAAAQRLEADLADPRFKARLSARRAGADIEIESLRLGVEGASLDAAGALSLAGRRPFRVAGRLGGFDPSRYANLPKASLDASLTAHGELEPRPTLELGFDLAGSRFAGQPLGGRGALSLLADRLTASELRLDVAGNKLELAGAYGRAGDRLRLSLDAPRLAVLGFGLEGSARAEASLLGTPARPAGEFSLSAARLGLPGGHRLASLEGRGSLSEGLDGVFELTLHAAGYRPPGRERALLVKAGMAAQGRRNDHRLTFQGEFDTGDVLDVTLAGALSDAPAWSGRLEAARLRGNPRYAAQLAAPASLYASAQRATLGAAELRFERARLHLLETEWRPGALVSRGEVSSLGLDLALDEAQRKLLAADSLRLGARWTLRLAGQAEGEARLVRESGDLGLAGERPLALGLSALALDVALRQDRLLARLDVQGTQLGTVSGSAAAWLERRDGGWALAREAPLEGELTASMPSLAALAPLAGPNLGIGGALEAAMKLSGTPARPRVTGTLAGERLGLALADQGLRLEQGRLRLAFDEQAATLAELSFAAPAGVLPRERRLDAARLMATPGRLSARGVYRYAEGAGELALEAERLPVMQRPERWVAISGAGRVKLAGGALEASGQARIDAGLLRLADADRPSLSDDVVVLGREAPARRGPALSLDVEADMGERFYLTGRGLDTRLEGSLRLRLDARGPLRASGTIATRGGSYDAYGQSLAIERGIVNFQGPPENPGLNVLALRKKLPVEAGVSITGTAQHPRVRLYSEPEVPDSEKLAWIVLGRGPDESGGETGLLLSAASAILGGDAEGMSKQLAASLGLDEISLAGGGLDTGAASRLPRTTVAGGATRGNDPNLSAQVVSLGKRLTADVFLSYEQSLGGAGSIVKLTYALGRRLSLVGRAGSDNAIDLYYTFRFN